MTRIGMNLQRIGTTAWGFAEGVGSIVAGTVRVVGMIGLVTIVTLFVLVIAGLATLLHHLWTP